MRKEFGDDYLIINEAIFLSEIKSYRLRSCLCAPSYYFALSYAIHSDDRQLFYKDRFSGLYPVVRHF